MIRLAARRNAKLVSQVTSHLLVRNFRTSAAWGGLLASATVPPLRCCLGSEGHWILFIVSQEMLVTEFLVPGLVDEETE